MKLDEKIILFEADYIPFFKRQLGGWKGIFFIFFIANFWSVIYGSQNTYLLLERDIVLVCILFSSINYFQSKYQITRMELEGSILSIQYYYFSTIKNIEFELTETDIKHYIPYSSRTKMKIKSKNKKLSAYMEQNITLENMKEIMKTIKDRQLELGVKFYHKEVKWKYKK